MHQSTIAELACALREKKISAVELTSLYLKRIEALDKEINAFITVTPEIALAQAKTADARIAKGEAHALTGIPIAQKDIFCIEQVKTTCGSKMLADFVAPYNATMIRHCNDAGMVLLGKTNMDEFAMGSSNENSYFGPCRNPWDTNTVPGGSSGGSSAAIAARFAPAASATDTGGSIRQPAALCGVSGIKPTYGRISRYGMISYASSLDQTGPMAQTAEDLALLLQVMAGFDPLDSTSADIPVPDYVATLNDSLEGLRIGLPKEYFNSGLDARMAGLIQNAAREFERLGATLHEISLPTTPLSIPTYYIVAPAECCSNLSRFDGVRYGYRCENPKDLEDLYVRSRAEGFGPEVKRRILTGTYVLSAGHYDAYYGQAQRVRRRIKDDFAAAFQQVDLILGPTTPTPAFNIGERVDDPISMYLSDIFTTAVNLAGLPAMSIPGGFIDNMPVGVHLIGQYFNEARLLNSAHRYQQVTDWHKCIPDFAKQAV